MLCIWFWSCNPPAHFISQHRTTAPFRPVSSLPRYTRAFWSSYPILKACSSLKPRSHFKLRYKDFFNTPKAFLSSALTFSQPYKITLSITVLSLKINSLRYLQTMIFGSLCWFSHKRHSFIVANLIYKPIYN